MEELHLVGPVIYIDELLKEFGQDIVCDRWLSKPDTMDINVKVAHDKVDELTDWCEERHIELTIMTVE